MKLHKNILSSLLQTQSTAATIPFQVFGCEMTCGRLESDTKTRGKLFWIFFISSDAFLSKKCFGRLLQTSGSFGLSRKNKRAHKHLLFCVVILCLLHCYFPCLQSFVLHLWKGLLVTWLSIHMAEKAPPSRTNLTVKSGFSHPQQYRYRVKHLTASAPVSICSRL